MSAVTAAASEASAMALDNDRHQASELAQERPHRVLLCHTVAGIPAAETLSGTGCCFTPWVNLTFVEPRSTINTEVFNEKT